MTDAPQARQADTAYTELRRHELPKRMVVMLDGQLISNANNREGGISARAYRGGYWGFASAPDASNAVAAAQVQAKAETHARAMSRFGSRPALALPGGSYRGEHVHAGRKAWAQGELTDCLARFRGAEGPDAQPGDRRPTATGAHRQRARLGAV